jgi:nitric oxide reductase NorQ protein
MLEKPSVIIPRENVSFVDTPYVAELTERAIDYIKAGFPVHLNGPTGVGKTTLAFHIAGKLGRPAVLICGDHEFGTSDLVGGLQGYHKKFVVDNFIRSVLKTDESMTQSWVDNRLTTACEYGLTLIYDEFTRSRPEANNVLLAVLEERILPLPVARGGVNYIKVHQDFSAIFTSNPEEYAGVQKTQDALRDRLVSIELGNFDKETEIAIVHAKSNLSLDQSERIVELVRKVRDAKSNRLTPTVRASVMIGKVLNIRMKAGLGCNHNFKQVCRDVLLSDVPGDEKNKVNELIDNAIFE